MRNARQTYAACGAFRTLQDLGAEVRSIVPLAASTLVGPFDSRLEHGPERAAATVTIDGLTVDLLTGRDRDGEPFVEIVGRGCNLEGEAPGLYYPTTRPL